jgi:pilus assembly protein Flp/PilA
MKLALIRKLVRDNRGANMVEYIILVGVVALFAIAAFKYFNTSLRDKTKAQADQVEQVNDGEGE